MASEQPRRILLTADTAGGVWTFALELAQGLIERRFEICLATFGPTLTDEQRRSAGRISDLQWLHHTSKLEWMEEPWPDIKAAGHWLREVARAYRPELIHLNTLCHANRHWNLPVVTTVHSCVASWWAAVRKSQLPLEWNRYRFEVESSLRSSTLLIAPSRALLTDIDRHYNIDTTGSLVIHNGRNLAAFHTRPKEPLVLCAGRLWDDAKNISAVASVAPHLLWPVYLAGDAAGPNGQTMSPQENCNLLGQLGIAELSAWYSRAAIFAEPARYEPFGLSILEAALSGCALLLGDIPSLRELWLDAAIFVEPNDKDGLRRALRRLMDDSSLREEMSSRALNRSRQFTRTRMVNGYLAAYSAALEKFSDSNWRHACAS
jgi:glycosyltransferase involved in cell wall biosynthesis